jgi:tetratricopeptide (TPR) repeat protein
MLIEKLEKTLRKVGQPGLMTRTGYHAQPESLKTRGAELQGCIILRRFFVLTFLFVGLPGWGGAAAESWVEVRSPHFVVLTDSSEKQGRHVAGQLERMRAVFSAAFPKAHVDSGGSITVIAVKDKKGFQALEPEAYLAKGQLDLAGLFLRTPDKNYVLLRLDAQGDHPYATVYHEYTHYLVSDAAEWMPLWMNEGLAQFFENTVIGDKEARMGQVNWNEMQFVRQTPLIPLKVLLAVDYTSPYYHEEQKGSIFYGESWALMHMLQVADNTQHTQNLRDYAYLISQHVDPVTAGERAFGDLGQLQKALQSYISQMAHIEFQVKVPIAVNEASFTATPVSLTAANAERADFLAYNGREKDARALLDTVLQEDPKNESAHETMGFLEFRAGNNEAARKWYEEAVGLDSESYLAHYYYASLSMRGAPPAHPEAVEASLRMAIKLNPSFAPAYDQLATFYGMRHEKLDEAHLLNLKAAQLDPTNVGYRVNTATILQEAERYKDAITVLKTALGVAKSPADVASVEERIASLEKYEAQRERYAAESQTSAAKANSGPVSAQPAAAVELATPKHPTEAPHGARLMAKGVIEGVQCSEPAVIELTLAAGGKNFALYSNNYYKIDFSAANFTPEGEIHPCTDLQGMKATVQYSATSDKTVDGQILAVMLSK